MINIRQGAFETNSSSMHSLIIVKNGVRRKPYCDEESLKISNGYDVYGRRGYLITYGKNIGYIDVEENCFERYPFEILMTWIDKAIYLIAQWNNGKDMQNKIDKLTRIIHEEIPDFKGFKFKQEHAWNSKTHKFDDETSDDYGTVDHQSIGITPERRGLSIKEYLFNPKVMVVIDGDEYHTFEGLIEAGVIDKDNIIKQVSQ